MQAKEMEATNEDVSVNPWALHSSRNGFLDPLLYLILLFITCLLGGAKGIAVK